MDLQKILSVSGKPGLFLIIGQTKNGVIAEGLIDKKRIPIFATDKMSSLEDIRIFCDEEDVPLKDVFKKIFEKENEGKTSVNSNDSNDKLKEYFELILPNYDKERVYVSDIKKVINWYNLLLENKLISFEEELKEEKPNEKSEEVETTEKVDEKETKDETPAKTVKKTKKKVQK